MPTFFPANQASWAVLCAFAALSSGFSQTTSSIYAVGKAGQYVQTGTSTPSSDPAGAYIATAAGPSAGSFTSPNPNSQTRQLTYMASGGTFFGNNGDYEYDQTFATRAELDQSFPSGTYVFTRSGGSSISLPLTGDLYPPVPQILNGTWNGSGQLVIDPTLPYTFQFNTFTNYDNPSNAAGQIELTVQGPDGSEPVDASFISLDTPQVATTATISAGTLTAGSVYKAMLVFGTYVVADATTIPGTALLTTYANETSFTILAQAPTVGAPPVATAQPVSQTVATGSSVVFNFTVTGSPAPTYQWYLNGAAIAFANTPTLVVSGATAANAGAYTCVATNSSGSSTSSAASLSVVTTQDPGHLVNLSSRAMVGSGQNILIAGFAVSGAGSEPVLARVSGPAIAAAPYSVPGTLPDPQLQLFSGQTVLKTNNGWAGDPAIEADIAAVGAFAWPDASSHDSAIATSLVNGPYTAQVAGQSGDTGVALVEVYDATAVFTPSSPRLVNLSSRVQVGTGANILIAGFVIGGSTSETVLIRASGPAIGAAPFNVPGTLSDPELQVIDANHVVLASNSAWGGNLQIATVASAVGAFPWQDPTSKDAAIVITLPPGAYTAQVSGASGDTGVALVEVYEVP